MNPEEQLKQACSNNIENTILQTDIMEGDTAIFRSFMPEIEQKPTEWIKQVHLYVPRQVEELERNISDKQVPSIRPGFATTPAQDQQKETRTRIWVSDINEELNSLLVHFKDILNTEPIQEL